MPAAASRRGFFLRLGSTSERPRMSALPPKADIVSLPRYVCFVPKADFCTAENTCVSSGSDPSGTTQTRRIKRRQASGREERQRDRHIDLSNAAFVSCNNVLDAGDGAGNDLVKPTPATRGRGF